MGRLPWAPCDKASASAAWLVAACVLLLPATSISDDDASWLYQLTMNEFSKVMLCAVIAWNIPGKLRYYAVGGCVWYLGQMLIEAYSRIGCEDGYSAHGNWEYIPFAALFGAIYLCARRHE